MAGMITLLTMMMIDSMVVTTRSQQETTQRVRLMIPGTVDAAKTRRLLFSLIGLILGLFLFLIRM